MTRTLNQKGAPFCAFAYLNISITLSASHSTMELCTAQSVSNLPAVFPSAPSRRRLDSSAALRPSLIPGSARLPSLRNSGFISFPRASFNEESSTGASSVTTEESDTSASNRFFPPVTAYASADSTTEKETVVEPATAYASEDSTRESKTVVETDSLVTGFSSEKSTIENKAVTESPAAETGGEESPVSKQINELLDNLNIKVDSDDTYYLLLFGVGAVVALWIASSVVGAIDSIPLVPKLLEVVGLGYTVWFATRYLLFKDNRDEFFAKIEKLKQEVLGSTSD